MKSEVIAQASQVERKALFEHARVGLPMQLPAAMIEKDFWVSYILKRLFADQELSAILRFKGGTSLSKAHHLIERFSEDVDLIGECPSFDTLLETVAEMEKDINRK